MSVFGRLYIRSPSFVRLGEVMKVETSATAIEVHSDTEVVGNSTFTLTAAVCMSTAATPVSCCSPFCFCVAKTLDVLATAVAELVRSTRGAAYTSVIS